MNIQDPYTIQCNEFKRSRMLNLSSFDPDECKFECNLCGLKVKYNNMKSHLKCAKHKVKYSEWRNNQPNIKIELNVVLQIA
jgi:hypothetical protein